MGQGIAQHPWEPPRVLKPVDNRKKKLRATGNAVVPAVAEVVGLVVREVVEAHRE